MSISAWDIYAVVNRRRSMSYRNKLTVDEVSATQVKLANVTASAVGLPLVQKENGTIAPAILPVYADQAAADAAVIAGTLQIGALYWIITDGIVRVAQ